MVRNDGQNIVELTKLSVGCTSCTKATTPVRHLSAGDKAVINVVFTPGVLGPQKKSVTISYDNTTLRLEFIADVTN